MVLRTRRLEMRRKIMVTNDATILRIKHDVLYEVATQGSGSVHHHTGTAGTVPLLYL